MRRFLVKLQFNGKNYNGFQKNEGSRTIQGEIEKAIYKVFSQEAQAVGVSRTDAGVSASEYYFHFDMQTKLPADRVAYKLNRFLPNDIQCQDSMEIPPTFDARKNCVSKTYEYTLYPSEHIKPLINRNAVKVSPSIDVEAMKKGTQYLIGKHDFSSFKTPSTSKASPYKTVNFIDIKEQDEKIIFSINADGFLYNMVRIIVGTLVAVGNREIPPERVNDILHEKDRQSAGLTMPPKALVLKKVIYDTDITTFKNR